VQTTEAIRRITREALDLSLKATRLPLTTYETVLRRGADNSAWPPVVAFDSFEGTVKQFVGSLVRDEQLVEQGHLLKAKVGQLRKAVELEALAQDERRTAKAELEARRQRDEEQRKQIEQQTAVGEQRLEQQERARKQQVAEQAGNKKAQARKTEAAVEKALTKQERNAQRTKLNAESDALAAERRALAAQTDVLELDEKIDSLKEARSGR
jgi:hypothetical protein